MPRRTSKAVEADPNVEPRVTRRSLRSQDSPASSPTKPKESPSPASKARKTKQPAPKDDGEEAAVDSEELVAGTSPKSPSKGRGRPKGSANKRKRESDEEEEVNDEESASPARSRRKQTTTSPGNSDTSPRRQSSRGAAKAAAAAIEQQAVKDDEVEEEEDDTTQEKPGQKRKQPSSKEVVTNAEKKQKTEEGANAEVDDKGQTEPVKETEPHPVEEKAATAKTVEEKAKQDATVPSIEEEKEKPEICAVKEKLESSQPSQVKEKKDSKLTAINNNSSLHKNKVSPVKASPKKKSTTQGGPLFTRLFTSNGHLPKNCTAHIDRQFSIVTYNILADSISLKHKDTGLYQLVDRNDLPISKRHQCLSDELLYLDADIYCLQEVDQGYYKKLKLFMERNGYKGVFTKRPDKTYNEGEACFVRTSQFTIRKHESFLVHELAEKEMQRDGVLPTVTKALGQALEEKTILVLLQLNHIMSGNMLTLANTHLSWGSDFSRLDCQCMQISSCIKQLLNQAGEIAQPHIICGDFNSTPDTPGYQLLQDGYLGDENVEKLQKIKKITYQDQEKSAVDLWWKGFQHTSPVLQSAYHTCHGKEPLTSCFPHDHQCRAVDYIWYSHSSCDLIGVLETVPEKYMKTGIPNTICPSDHVSLKAVFQFK